MIRKNNRKIYLEIHNTYLLLIVIREKKDEFILDSQTAQIIPLDNLEFENGIVNNPSIILKFINNYIDSHNLKNPEAIICLRNSDQVSKELQQFMTLQISLFAAKATLRIMKIIHGPIMPWNNTSMLNGQIPKKDLVIKSNLFKLFYPPKNTNPQAWIVFSIILIITGSTLMVLKYFNTQTTLNNLKANLKVSIDENRLLAQKSKYTNSLITTKSEKILQLQESKPINNPCSDILKIFAKNIPDNSWLQSIKKDHNGRIEVICNTVHPPEVSIILKRLSTETVLKNISLETLEAMNKKDSRLYTFTIVGTLLS